jgi:hypothetical protein
MTALTTSSKTSTSNEPYYSQTDEAEYLRAQQLAGVQGLGEVINPEDEFTGLMMEDLSLAVNSDKQPRE